MPQLLDPILQDQASYLLRKVVDALNEQINQGSIGNGDTVVFPTYYPLPPEQIPLPVQQGDLNRSVDDVAAYLTGSTGLEAEVKSSAPSISDAGLVVRIPSLPVRRIEIIGSNTYVGASLANTPDATATWVITRITEATDSFTIGQATGAWSNKGALIYT